MRNLIKSKGEGVQNQLSKKSDLRATHRKFPLSRPSSAGIYATRQTQAGCSHHSTFSAGYPAGPHHNPSSGSVLSESFPRECPWRAWFSRLAEARQRRPFSCLNLQEYRDRYIAFGYITLNSKIVKAILE